MLTLACTASVLMAAVAAAFMTSRLASRTLLPDGLTLVIIVRSLVMVHRKVESNRGRV